MAFIMRALRGNAHALNYALLGGATLAPVLLFSLMRSPTQEQVEHALLEDHGDSLSRGRQHQTQINAFWRTKKSSPEMDEIYHGLLRSGRSSVKRHYELTGTLASEEARQNPEYSRIQALLALPGDEEGASAAPAPVAAAAASGAAPVGSPQPPAVAPAAAGGAGVPAAASAAR